MATVRPFKAHAHYPKPTRRGDAEAPLRHALFATEYNHRARTHMLLFTNYVWHAFVNFTVSPQRSSQRRLDPLDRYSA
jgi:hypothetical protein